MTKVDFYILSDKHTGLEFTSRLTEKIYRQGHQLHIHTADASMAEHLDMLLWSYRDISFIPHERTLDAADNTPVTIGHSESAPACDGILINLANDVPKFFSRFERVVEIVDGDNSHRQQGRVRYKYYRDRGYELTSHEID